MLSTQFLDILTMLLKMFFKRCSRFKLCLVTELSPPVYCHQIVNVNNDLEINVLLNWIDYLTEVRLRVSDGSRELEWVCTAGLRLSVSEQRCREWAASPERGRARGRPISDGMLSLFFAGRRGGLLTCHSDMYGHVGQPRPYAYGVRIETDFFHIWYTSLGTDTVHAYSSLTVPNCNSKLERENGPKIILFK